MTDRTRPSAWWFVLGGGLLLAAAGTGIALFVWTLGGFLAVDASVPVDDAPHRVEVGTDGDRMLWVEDGGRAPDCTVVDSATGATVDLGGVTGRYLREVDGVERVGHARFDPGSGELEVTCAGGSLSSDAEVEIGPAPQVAGLVGRIATTLLVPLLLGGLGLVVLLVTGLRWSSRR